ncbi:UTP--glucose-1-phosphate uridylyltransferase [Candidatus Beckwithbacteria bacterium CG10_big_fil_rev_8_21_14_0_10_34_10]|uniref:UTP--glucose-1-phosphate uridylyltransferase n=1 Tax=Candidatus Beckwithbacteria bacterium CG10_big_fil_rev_8_21_14_0_10_34_10 TaxID=1974495 RepID=A0A2H0WAC6_9BACT|nr:MAG: UTP--glucose-1-phosphate uridylyltransferase [Candidatus Beckwithbacteria bacterium CG10_big_fil_rev_8_21_14_0_10_34_10]
MKKITKAVIAVAGYGTRFLPATKNQPKEMLPIIDKPIVQYLVEEAVASGIKDIILVTRFGQSSLENHFDTNMELEIQLEKNGKKEALEKVQRTYRMANFIYIRQGRHLPYGNATPLLCIHNVINRDEPFVYMFGDDLVKGKIPCVKQLMNVYYKENPAAVIAVQETAKEEIERYGVVKYKKGTKINQIDQVLEKMPASRAPSSMAQFGRFIFTPKVLRIAREHFESGKFGKDNELWVADLLNELAKKEKVIAQPIKGKWMTTGDPLRYMKTMVEFALDREDIGAEFSKYLKELNLS